MVLILTIFGQSEDDGVLKGWCSFGAVRMCEGQAYM